MAFGTLAAAFSAVCIAVFFHVADAAYGRDLAKMPWPVHLLRGFSFYTAGSVLAVCVARCRIKPQRSAVQHLLLLFGGCLCLWVAEIVSLFFSGLFFSASEAVLANVGFRSVLLIMFVCRMLAAPLRKLRLAATVILGTAIWIILFGLTGALNLPDWTYWSRSSFNTAWSIVAAGQIWWILKPPQQPGQERKRTDFLPDKIDV